MNKLFIALVVLVVVIVGILGGGWYYLGTVKTALQPSFITQVNSFKTVREKVDAATVMYQEDAQPSVPQANQNKQVKVLGAKTTRNLKEEAIERMGVVLGIEDTAEMKRSRDIVEVLTQAEEAVRKISDTNISLTSNSSLSFLQSFMKVNPPTHDTQNFVSDITPILEVLRKEQDLTVRAYSTGFDLGASFQLAVMRADEDSVAQLERKINDLSRLSDEEIALAQMPMPTELKQILDSSATQGQTVVKQFKDIPSIIRKKDALALQKSLTNMVVDSTGASVKQKSALVSFLKNNATLRSIDSLKTQWSDSSKRLE
jgi:hypothetical protein